MGAVYRARHSETGAVHALKLVLVADRPGMEDFLVERFQREVEVLARVEGHPGLVRVYACGEEAGIPWYSMELVEGSPLSAELKQRVLGHRQAASLVVQVARAVAHAHRQGVVHRDLKPSNILVDTAGQARLADFGLAHDAAARRLTLTGEILGTPQFMAPEQVEADESSEFGGIGPATDVYGLGAVLYACLAGQPPFGRKPAGELMIDIVSKDVAAPSTHVSGIPQDLDAVCMRALAREPERRYRSAGDLADDLERWLRGDPVEARPVGLLETIWRRYRPRSRAGRWVAGGVALALCVMMLFGVLSLSLQMYRQLFLATIGERLQALSFKQKSHGKLDAAGREELESLSSIVKRAGEPGDDKKLELIRLLETVVVTSRVGDSEAAKRLTTLVRHEGKIDSPLLDHACKVLRHRQNRPHRFDVLAQIVYRGVPVQLPKGQLTVVLAEAMAEAGSVVDQPYEQEYFSHLYKAVDKQVQRALLQRRSRQARERRDWSEALSVALMLRDEHDLVMDYSEWPQGLLEVVQEKFVDLVASEPSSEGKSEELVTTRLRTLQNYMDILVRAPDRRGPVNFAQIERVLRPLAQVTDKQGRMKDPVHSSELLELLVFLERRGKAPFGPDFYARVRPHFSLQEFTRKAEVEIDRHKKSRNPLRCLVLAYFLLCGPHQQAEKRLAADCIKAAIEVGLKDDSSDGPPRWQSVFESYVRDLLNGRDESDLWDDAREAWEKALEADRYRPPERRWPRLVREVLDRELRILGRGIRPESSRQVTEGDESGSGQRSRRVAELGIELLDVFEAAWRPWAWGQSNLIEWTPWLLATPHTVAVLIRTLANQLLVSSGDQCCGAGWQTSSGRHVIEELLDRALELIATDDSSGSHTVFIPLKLAQARHHQRHGRLVPALLGIDESLARALQMERRNVRHRRKRLEFRSRCLELRVQVLRGLGRQPEADAADLERQAVVGPMLQAQALDYLDVNMPDKALSMVREALKHVELSLPLDAEARRQRLELVWELHGTAAEAERLLGQHDAARVSEQKAQQVLDKLESLR